MAKFIGNPEGVRKLSNEIRELYNEADDVSLDILNCVRKLPDGWEGDASIAYQNQFWALGDLIDNAIESFEMICKMLDELACTLEEGEKDIWQDFRNWL